MIIGEEIRKIRRSLGMSLESLALDADTTATNIYRIETGKSKPRYDTVEKLLDCMGSELVIRSKGGSE